MWKTFLIVVVILVVAFVAYDLFLSSKVTPSSLEKNPQVTSTLDKASLTQRDAKRLSDVRQFKVQLDLYKQAKGQYPQTLQQLASYFSTTTPQAPQPADSPCNSANNNYVYTPTSSSYALKFCLGTSGEENYSSGVHTLTPGGIQ